MHLPENEAPDPFVDWTLEDLEDALRDATHVLYLIGALNQRNLDFDTDATRLRRLSPGDRELLRRQTDERMLELRSAISARIR